VEPTHAADNDRGRVRPGGPPSPGRRARVPWPCRAAWLAMTAPPPRPAGVSP